MCRVCTNESCVPDCCLPCGHIMTRKCLQERSSTRCASCNASFKMQHVYPFFPTWELSTPAAASSGSSSTPIAVNHRAGAATVVELDCKLQAARAACDLVSATVRQRKRDRELATPLVAQAPQVLKTTLLYVTPPPASADVSRLQNRGHRLREMVDLVPKVTLDDALQPAQSASSSFLCTSEQFYCDSNGEVQTLIVAVTADCKIVVNSKVDRAVRIPVAFSVCKAAAMRFLVAAGGDEFYVVAVVDEKGQGGLFRYSLQRGGEIVLLFPFASTDFILPEGPTATIDRFVEICGDGLCLVSAVVTQALCGMYHVLVVEFSCTSGFAKQLLRVAMPVLVHSCPHRMLLQDEGRDAQAAADPSAVARMLQEASWGVRIHRFATARRTVALLSCDGILDGDVLEEVREGHRDVLLVRETLTCLSVYAVSGAVLGSIHSDAPIADFAWCRDEHRGYQNRLGGDEMAFYGHIFVLGFDWVLREYAIHV